MSILIHIGHLLPRRLIRPLPDVSPRFIDHEPLPTHVVMSPPCAIMGLKALENVLTGCTASLPKVSPLSDAHLTDGTAISSYLAVKRPPVFRSGLSSAGTRHLATQSHAPPNRLLKIINEAESFQEVLDIYYDYFQEPTSQRIPDISSIETMPGRTSPSISGSKLHQMRPSLLAALVCKAVHLVIMDRAHTGLSTQSAVAMARRLLSQVMAELSTRTADLTVVDIERILDASSKMKLEPGPALKTELIWWLRPEGGGRIRSASAAGLSSITLSLMNLGWLDHDRSFVETLASAAIKRAAIGSFNGASLALMTRALSQANHADIKTYQALSVAARSLVPTFPVSDMVVFIYSLSMAGGEDPLLFPEIASRVLPHLSSMTPRELSLLMSAFAKARILHELLFEGIAENFIESKSVKQVDDFGRILKAFSTLGIYPQRLFVELSPQILSYLQKGVLIADKRKSRDTQRAQNRRRSNQPSEQNTAPIFASSVFDHNLADIAWAYGQAGYHHHGLYDMLAYQAVSQISSIQLPVMGQLCDGFRLSRHHHPDLVAAVASYLGRCAFETSGTSILKFGLLREEEDNQPQESWTDIEGIVNIIAFLTRFGHNCRDEIQAFYPCLLAYLRHISVTEIGMRADHICNVESRSNQVGKLLQPLTHQLYKSQGDSKDDRMWTEICITLMLEDLSTLLTVSNGCQHLPDFLTLQVAQATIALKDSGVDDQMLVVALGDKKADLDICCENRQKHIIQEMSSSTRERQQYQAQRLLREELSLSQIDDSKASTLSRDGNCHCLLLVTKAGQSYAFSVCGQEMFSSDGPVTDPLADSCLTTENSAKGRAAKPLVDFELHASSIVSRGWRPVLLSPRQWELLTSESSSYQDSQERNEALKYVDQAFSL